MQLFAKNLAYLMKAYGVRQTQLASYMDKAQTTIANWVNKQSEPNIDGLVKIVQYFGVSLDDLIFTDLEKGKVITQDHIVEFHKKGKLNGKGNGKESPLIRLKITDSTDNSTQDDVNTWNILNALKVIDGKIENFSGKLDQLLVSGKKTDGKGP